MFSSAGAAGFLFRLLDQRFQLFFLRENLQKIEEERDVIMLPSYVFRFPLLEFLLFHQYLLRCTLNLGSQFRERFVYGFNWRIVLAANISKFTELLQEMFPLLLEFFELGRVHFSPVLYDCQQIEPNLILRIPIDPLLNHRLHHAQPIKITLATRTLAKADRAFLQSI